MNSILILGGTAFVGEALARYFIDNDFTVDILTRGKLPVKYPGVRNHLKGNRKSFEEMEKLLKNQSYDYVIDVSGYHIDDLKPVLKYLDLKSLKKYAFCSSGGVYGFSEKIMDENTTRVSDLSSGAYCLDKRNCEDLLFEHYETTGLPIAILRPSYIYGKGNNQLREAYYFKKILEHATVQMPHGKENLVNFIHIDDLVKLFHSVIENPKTTGRAYNATNDEAISWKYYIEALNDATQEHVIIEEVSYERLLAGEKIYFPFRDEQYELSIDRLREDGLYLPQIDLKRGLQMSYDWFCINENRMEL